MIYRFNSIVIDTDNYSLSCQGKPKAVEPQVFDLIVYLIENREKLASRQQIFDDLWKSRIVTDATLSNHIKSARAVLGDDGERQNVIKTVRGRGYQFIAKIQDFTVDEPQRNDTSSIENHASTVEKVSIAKISAIAIIIGLFLFAGFKLAVNTSKKAGVERKSIAVIPFENRSNLEKDAFFTDGIHDDLLTRISKIRALKTISRTSVMVYRDTLLSAPAIGEELHVSMILEGGVQRAGNQIRINVQLINAVEDEHIWAATYTRELNAENIFAIQSEIAQTVASELEIILSPDERQSTQKLPTQNMAALEAWFQAKEAQNRGTVTSLQDAAQYLEEAIKLDPGFAMAYATLASAYISQIYLGGLPREKQLALAAPLIGKALALDKNLSVAYIALGTSEYMHGNRHAATQAYKTALELNPGNAQAYYLSGRLNEKGFGQREKAVSLYTKALELNPKEDNWRVALASVLFKLGRFEESRKIYQEIIQRRPDFAPAHWGLSDLQFYVDADIPATLLSGSRHLKLDPNIPVNATFMGFTYEHIGETERAIQWLSYSLDIAPESTISAITRAEISMLHRDYNKAFDEYIAIGKGDRALYYLMESALKSGRTKEAIKHFKKNYPDLFGKDVQIGKISFTRAYTLARLLKENGAEGQANYLLSAALPFALVDAHEAWIGMHNNWPARIYMLQENHKAALAQLSKNVGLGFVTDRILKDSVFEPLQDNLEFQTIMAALQDKLEQARQKTRAMESSGEIILPPNKKPA